MSWIILVRGSVGKVAIRSMLLSSAETNPLPRWQGQDDRQMESDGQSEM